MKENVKSPAWVQRSSQQNVIINYILQQLGVNLESDT